ncbi:MAG: site-2 protease family protein, partial [Pirellula sp.]
LQEFEGKKLSNLQPGDKILGADGVLLESNDKAGEFFGYQLDEVLHPRLDKKVELSVERNTGSSKQTVVVPIDPLPLKTMGLRFAPDAVTVVASESPASAAGIRMGDVPTKFNGQLIEDAITLPNRIATMAGQSVKVEFARANSDPIVLEWTVPNRFLLENNLPMYGAVGMELPGAGLVYLVSPKITSMVPGSEASKSGLQAGDLLKQVAFGKLSDTQASYLKDTKLDALFSKQAPVDNVKNLQYIHSVLQALPAGLPFDLVVERESKIETATVAIHEETDVFSPDRRIALAPYRQTYYAKSVGGALQKGFQEIRRGIGDVLEFLGLIVTGKAFNYIGGPATIAVQATSAASEGESTLLMFLTLLSANLAVVNFLPVPALDGGHMVFLAAEAITGKPVNEDLQVKLTIGGIIALLCLMILAFRNDFLHLFGAWM